MSGPEVAVFVEAPRLGAVKPGLAREIGERQALRLYRVMAARTLEAVERAALEATVWFTPADAAQEMRFWLGEGRRLVPQASGDPGARLAASLRSAAPGRGWLALAPDCPGLDAGLLLAAAAHVVHGDPVVGPTHDGGYYLIGGMAPLPDLFSGMPWGSTRVLSETRARLAHAGRVWRELPMLRSVSTAADAQAEGLLT
jgi:rSAM/selenodomain-associated transferase 1